MSEKYHTVARRIMAMGSIVLLASAMSGCGGLTSYADSKQKPSVAKFETTESTERLFSASVHSLARMGEMISTDRQSGIAQGKKGNWVITATVAQSSPGSMVSVTARYVPSDQFDFNSRQGLTAEFVEKVEEQLGVSLRRM